MNVLHQSYDQVLSTTCNQAFPGQSEDKIGNPFTDYCFMPFANKMLGSPSDETELSKGDRKMSRKSKAICKKEKITEDDQNDKKKNARRFWKAEEDSQLLELVEKYGTCWKIVSSMMPGRTGKQCRDRYLNQLRPGVNLAPWTPSEDELLLSLYNQHGSKWVMIASQIQGRTESQVKNRFYKNLKHRINEKQNEEMQSQPHESELSSSNNNALNNTLYLTTVSTTEQDNRVFTLEEENTQLKSPQLVSIPECSGFSDPFLFEKDNSNDFVWTHLGDWSDPIEGIVNNYDCLFDYSDISLRSESEKSELLGALEKRKRQVELLLKSTIEEFDNFKYASN